jgi:hypothetical protein
MLRVVFEPTILAFEPAKTVHDLDRSATVFVLALFTLPYRGEDIKLDQGYYRIMRAAMKH